MKLATVFSGIGAIEQALKKLNIEYNIIFACDTGERYIDIPTFILLSTIFSKSIVVIIFMYRKIYFYNMFYNYSRKRKNGLL